jgi:phosphoribosyl 1,2-cyclic phosphodiesterase
LADVDLLVLESNHCPRLLQRGPYPSWLKRRIASPLGHLSNVQAGDAIRAVAGPRLRHLLLAHLSENNNDPRTAFDAMRAVLAESAPAVNLLVCRQHQIGSWIDLEGE